VEFTWLPRNGSEPGTTTALAEAMMAASLPQENSFVWFAAEAGVVRTLRRHFLLDRGLERSRMAMAGYWKKGETDFRDREDTP
jgi:NADPH-dependent ferric siderophore reductase